MPYWHTQTADTFWHINETPNWHLLGESLGSHDELAASTIGAIDQSVCSSEAAFKISLRLRSDEILTASHPALSRC